MKRYLSKRVCRTFFTAGIIVVLCFSHTVDAGWMQANWGLPQNASVRFLAPYGGKIFAGTDSSGVYYSANDGSFWTAIDSGLPSKIAVWSFVATGNKMFIGTGPNGVFRSVNNGALWTEFNNGLSVNISVGALALSGSDIFAGTNAGVFLFPDSATKWTASNTGISNMNVSSLAVRGSDIFAGTNAGVFLSANNGTTWTPVGPMNLPVYSLAVSGSNIFAGTGAGVVHFTDTGNNYLVSVSSLSTTSGVRSIAANRGLVFAGTMGNGVYLSTDNCMTWKPLRETYTNATILSLAMSDSTVFAGTSTSGVLWRPLSDIVALTKLTIQQQYIMPINYYNFSWGTIPGATTYDLYGNDVLFRHALQQNSASGIEVGQIIDSIGKATGKPIKYNDTVTFYVVARSNTNQILGISDMCRKRFIMAIGIQNPQAIRKNPGIRISGSTIDCSSLKETVRIALYSLKGEKLWDEKGIGKKIMAPARLPQGVYTVEISGVFGKVDGIIVQK